MRKAYEDSDDPYLALLDYRNTPISGMKYSPAQLLMSRRLRDKLPASSRILKPEIPTGVSQTLKKRQAKQKQYYDRGVKGLPKFKIGQSVRVRKGRTWQPAIVKEVHDSPRSYVVTSQVGQDYRRNRRHLLDTPENVVVRPPMEEDLITDVMTPQQPRTTPHQIPPTPQTLHCATRPPEAPQIVPQAMTPVRISSRATQKPVWHKDYDM
jgi:hypothetical protein